ncbi:histidine kinase dimerization/phosphoacceptor domain -containing protein [Jannaschia seohaensis]|uniref:Two-component sensor histidine kinase n=1 Tax=Jannaschia seohaensis TaxID=475081 RepID=A0A2Y9APA0_9RHOB|nr:histidine kinase dimerization/phosphoacceptor domain -containing protein [Jannaschia seohaensis]PWJ19303.1 two-component sensor histidine kinase [Jannaschia seohaensis]SSA45965.1 Two-component sensor histidine kinase, contains HisKA and HATPase domains [Jannaschia seohaensis]
MLAPTPANQAQRLAAIREFDLGAQVHTQRLAGLVDLASQITDCPIALISIVREEGQSFEAACGLDVEGTDLQRSVCSFAILQEDILEIEDMRADPRTADNPLVTDPADPLLFYAGAPIVTADGVVLGSLCVLDRRPRRLGDQQRQALRVLADQAMRMLELHKALRAADELRREADHRVKNSLASIAAMTRMTARRSKSEETKAALAQVEARIAATSALHRELYRQDIGAEGIEVSDYIAQIVRHLAETAPEEIAISCRIEPLRLRGTQASALGLLINEMVSNAIKHGFPEERPGSIRVVGRLDEAQTYVLTCTDDGIGGAAKPSSSGLGGRLMQASALQLGGTMEHGPRTDGAGYLAELRFMPPLPAD